MQRALTLLVLALPLAAHASDVPLDVSHLGGQLPPAGVGLDEGAARAVFESQSWQQADPTLSRADRLDVKVRRFGRSTLLRAVPVVEGAPVEGADRVVVVREGRVVRARAGAPLVKQRSFVLSAGEAVLAASTSVPANLFKDPTVERLDGFARRVWVSHEDGIYAAWRVRVPTLELRELSDVWVDASTGAVLKRLRVARFADGGVSDGGDEDLDAGEPGDDAGEPETDAGEPDAGEPETDAGEPETDAGPAPPAPSAASVFQYAPSPSGATEVDLVNVDLPYLRDAAVGSYLRGDYVSTFNCCKEYVCLDGADDCLPDLRRCARDDDEDPITSDLDLEIETEGLPIPSSIPVGEVLYARTVFCAELPRARSEGDGWHDVPVDVERSVNGLAGLASEEDAFAEAQVYYSTMQFFLHLREVLEDDTWCLGGVSMQCDTDGLPVLDEVTGEPARPYHVTTNLLIPEIDTTSLATQLFNGRGSDPGNPIIVDDYQRIDNAAFVPALSGAPVEVPEQFEELLAVFNREFDSNLYFQGIRDFSYDGDIVFHEFTHAVVYSYVPQLGSLWHDQWGAHAEPGAMNEGWSDYFSASFTGDSATGEYGATGITGGELGLRDADNEKRCPDDINGAVHDDSQPWSAALWDIREALIAAEGEDAVPALDQALLLALAQSESNETFDAQAARVLTAVEDAFGAGLRGSAEEAFDAHGIRGCERVWPLSVVDGDDVAVTPKEKLFLPGPDEAGTAGFAPGVMQMRVEVPAGTTSLLLRWTQQEPTVAGFGGGGGEPVVPRVLFIEADEPVSWRYDDVEQAPSLWTKGGESVAFDPLADGNRSVVGAPNSNGVSNANFLAELDEAETCEPRTFHVIFANRQQLVEMRDIQVDEIESAGTTACGDQAPSDGGPDGGDGAPEDCSCTTASAGGASWLFGALALLGTLGGLRRRRRA